MLQIWGFITVQVTILLLTFCDEKNISLILVYIKIVQLSTFVYSNMNSKGRTYLCKINPYYTKRFIDFALANKANANNATYTLHFLFLS